MLCAMCGRLAFALAGLLAAGCKDDAPGAEGDGGGGPTFDGGGGGPDGPPPEESVLGFVIDSATLPTDAERSDTFAFDVDGDGEEENALGTILTTYASFGGTPQTTLDDALAAGELLEILRVSLHDLRDDLDAELEIFVGADLDEPQPDPSDNFSGMEEFAALEARGPMPAEIAGGRVRAGPGRAFLLFPLVNASALSLELFSVRFEANLEAGTLRSGRLGGGLAAELIESEVLPAVAEQMNSYVEGSCTGPCEGCTPEAEQVLTLFDGDGDCAISVEDLGENDLVRALLAPDLDLCTGSCLSIAEGPEPGEPRPDGENDALSMGFGVTAVSARIE